MIKRETKDNIVPKNYFEENVCDLWYLTEMMDGKKHLMKGMMELFLQQVPEELQSLTDAIIKIDYAAVKSFAHSMKSSVSIMGISLLAPVLDEMENLGSRSVDIEKIKELNQKLNIICTQAIEEIEKEKDNYV